MKNKTDMTLPAFVFVTFIAIMLGFLLANLFVVRPHVVERNQTFITEKLVIANVTSTFIKECAPCACMCTTQEPERVGPDASKYSVHGGWAQNNTWWEQ